MDQEELITKLSQIEEQAQLTLREFPKRLTKEQQRMIIALARYIAKPRRERKKRSSTASRSGACRPARTSPLGQAAD